MIPIKSPFISLASRSIRSWKMSAEDPKFHPLAVPSAAVVPDVAQAPPSPQQLISRQQLILMVFLLPNGAQAWSGSAVGWPVVCGNPTVQRF